MGKSKRFRYRSACCREDKHGNGNNSSVAHLSIFGRIINKMSWTKMARVERSVLKMEKSKKEEKHDSH